MPKDIDMTATSAVPSSSQAQPLEGELLPAAKELAPLSSDYPTDHLPANVRGRRSRRWRWIAVAVLLAAGAAGGGVYWKYFSAPPWPPGIAFSDGRVEAEEIDIDAKFAERVAQLLVDEGDVVSPGQIVARMDIRDVQASLNRAEAPGAEAQETLDEAKANVSDTTAQLKLAKQEFDRTNALVARGFATYELLDQRQQALVSTTAALAAANNRAGEASRALEAAQHSTSSSQGQYRRQYARRAARRTAFNIASPSPARCSPPAAKSSRCSTSRDVYMDIYLPTLDAGRVKIGADARIVLDAYPDHPIRSKVTFLATQAQFTPKAVETKSERDKLMFRVKVRIDPDILTKYAESLRTGLPGNAYIRVDPKVEWPAGCKAGGTMMSASSLSRSIRRASPALWRA